MADSAFVKTQVAAILDSIPRLRFTSKNTSNSHANTFLMRAALMIASLLFCLAAKAQEWQGRGVVGGSVGLVHYNSNTSDSVSIPIAKNRNSQLSFNPHIGYRISDAWLVGLRAGYVQSDFKSLYDRSLGTYEVEYLDYYVGLFFRRYIKSSNKLVFIVEPAIEYKYKSNKFDFIFPGSDVELSAHQYSVMIAPGAIYYLSKRINLIARFGKFEAGFNTNKTSYSTEANQQSSFIGLDINPTTFYLGAEFKL